MEYPFGRSAVGWSFLDRLHRMSFGDGLCQKPIMFVDEFELPARHDDEKGGAPDYAVLGDGLVWLIELKTERASHRATQVPGYFELAHHHYPVAHVELTYVTPPMAYDFTATAPDRYAHVSWARLVPVIQDLWNETSEPTQAAVVSGLCATLDALDHSGAEWRAPPPGRADAVLEVGDEVVAPESETVAHALALAVNTAADGVQRGVDVHTESLQALLGLRLCLRNALAESPTDSPLRCVLPWLWKESSGGAPLTENGAAHGIELRLSRYRTARL
ncbi:MAG: hypothetical protein ACXWBO_00730 [Ilumatobacteraceae bacterium]